MLCSEGKTKAALPLTAKVPAVKRTVEKFVFCLKHFLYEVNKGGAFWLGNLKHKDLQGNEVSSQASARVCVCVGGGGGPVGCGWCRARLVGVLACQRARGRPPPAAQYNVNGDPDDDNDDNDEEGEEEEEETEDELLSEEGDEGGGQQQRMVGAGGRGSSERAGVVEGAGLTAAPPLPPLHAGPVRRHGVLMGWLAGWCSVPRVARRDHPACERVFCMRAHVSHSQSQSHGPLPPPPRPPALLLTTPASRTRAA